LPLPFEKRIRRVQHCGRRLDRVRCPFSIRYGGCETFLQLSQVYRRGAVRFVSKPCGFFRSWQYSSFAIRWPFVGCYVKITQTFGHYYVDVSEYLCYGCRFYFSSLVDPGHAVCDSKKICICGTSRPKAQRTQSEDVEM
jgi:hypothetical protein